MDEKRVMAAVRRVLLVVLGWNAPRGQVHLDVARVLGPVQPVALALSC
jgi:hypothetical protein